MKLQPQQQRPNFDATAMIPGAEAVTGTEADRVLLDLYNTLGPVDTTLADVLSESLGAQYESFVPVPSALLDPNLRGSAVLAACSPAIAEAIEKHHVRQDAIREEQRKVKENIKEGVQKALNG